MRVARVSLACALLLLLAAVPARATLPPGVTTKTLADNVVLYEHPATPQQLPSFWDTFLTMFGIQKDRRLSFAFGRSVAVLVGISNYTYLTPRLEYTNKDVEKMRDYLLGEGGFDAVYVMDGRATPQLVSSYLMDKGRLKLGSEDRLLFYYSGHATDTNDGKGGGYPYLQFRDAKPGEWGHDVLRVDEYQVWSAHTPVKHALFIFDACFAGEALPKADPRDHGGSIAELSADGSRMVVTAGTAEQRAWMLKASADAGYSLFTEALVRALQEGAADRTNRGYVTILQAVAEAQSLLAEMTLKLGPGHEMNPQPVAIPSNRKGTFVFLNSRAQKPSLPEADARYLGVAVAKGTGPEQDRELELAYWKSIEAMNDPALFNRVCDLWPGGVFCPVARKRVEGLKPAETLNLEKATLAELRSLASQGVHAALTQLGRAYESGLQGAPQDLKTAINYYTQAANLGDGEAAGNLGQIYYFGRPGIPVDLKSAAHWFDRGVSLGHAASMGILGTMYETGKGGLTKDEGKAAELYKTSANFGDSQGMANLGYMYETGKGGLIKDEGKAAELYKKSGDLGNPWGIAYLGAMYETGKGGLTKDEGKAAELYKKSADLGNTWAMVTLGYIYAHGEGGVAKDEAKAVDLYKKAADLGDATGMANLGDMYENGKGGLAKDEAKAVDLYKKAADLGGAAGMADLGDMYENGKGGLPRDLAKAIVLYKRGAELGSSYAEEQLKRLGQSK